MMGDNRQNSLDARFWGYVPFDHVVGKPVFVWMSISGVELGLKNIANWKFNWNRIFTTVNGNGKPIHTSLILLLPLSYGKDLYSIEKKKKR